MKIECFEGNKAETKTILPVVKAFQARHNLDSFVVVTDAGMLSAENLKELDAAGFNFVVGSRQSKAPHDLESYFHWNGELLQDRQIIDTVTPQAWQREGEQQAVEGRTGVGRDYGQGLAGGVTVHQQACPERH